MAGGIPWLSVARGPPAGTVGSLCDRKVKPEREGVREGGWGPTGPWGLTPKNPLHVPWVLRPTFTLYTFTATLRSAHAVANVMSGGVPPPLYSSTSPGPEVPKVTPLVETCGRREKDLRSARTLGFQGHMINHLTVLVD